MLDVDNVSYAADGKPILNRMSFSLKDRGKMLVLGPSGSGKTTLLAILAGLLTPDEGEVRYDNQSLYAQRATEIDRFRGQNIGVIFQGHHLVRPLTVVQNLQLGLSFTDKRSDQGCVEQTLGRLNLSQQAHQKASTLSMGEAQRLAVARAVIGKPKWILCDEPTSALDDSNAEATLRLLEEEAKDCGASLIIVTHDNRVKSFFSGEQVIELGGSA